MRDQDFGKESRNVIVIVHVLCEILLEISWCAGSNLRTVSDGIDANGMNVC